MRGLRPWVTGGTLLIAGQARARAGGEEAGRGGRSAEPVKDLPGIPRLQQRNDDHPLQSDYSVLDWIASHLSGINALRSASLACTCSVDRRRTAAKAAASA